MEINSLCYTPSVTVRYLGAEFFVPGGTKFIAVDLEGELWAYLEQPVMVHNSGVWTEPGPADSAALHVADVSDFGDWRKSLREVKPC